MTLLTDIATAISSSATMWAPATAAALTLSLLFRTIGPSKKRDELAIDETIVELEKLLRAEELKHSPEEPASDLTEWRNSMRYRLWYEAEVTPELPNPEMPARNTMQWRNTMTYRQQMEDELTYDPEFEWENEVMRTPAGSPLPPRPMPGADPYMLEEEYSTAEEARRAERKVSTPTPSASQADMDLTDEEQAAAASASANSERKTGWPNGVGPDIPYDEARHGVFGQPLPKKGWWVGALRFPAFETRLGNMYKAMWPQRTDEKTSHPGGHDIHTFRPILPASMEDAWNYGHQCGAEGTFGPEPPAGLKLEPLPLPETSNIDAGRDVTDLNRMFFQIRLTEAHRRMMMATLAPILFCDKDSTVPIIVDENVQLNGCTVHLMAAGAFGLMMINAADERNIRDQVTELAKAGEVMRHYSPEGMVVIPIVTYATDALSYRAPWLYRTDEGYICWVMGVHHIRATVYRNVVIANRGGLNAEELYRSQRGQSLSEAYMWMQEEDLASARKRVDSLHLHGLPDVPAGVNEEPSPSFDKDAPGVAGDGIRSAVENAGSEADQGWAPYN